MTNILTDNELKRLVFEAIITLQNNNFNIQSTNLKDVYFSNLGEIVGKVDILDKNEYEIVLNRKLANDTKIDFLLCAIYHELCHIIQFNEAFDNDIIDFNKKAQSILNISINETLLKNTIFDFAFHSQLWEDIAKEINSKIKLTVPVKAFLSSVELNSFLEDFYMKNKPIFTAPATIIDYTISGLTINDIENFTGKSKNSNINEQLVTDVALKHEYKKWLKEETYDK